ncbi:MULTISPECIES: hypothetical protein [unclassified Rhodanobacter]|uniref:hypothetical protein n=1 Tax=unclassified Rhodanobacter TaxID=2621553 RepID=UPI000AC846B6|nr:MULTISPECIES: hypothetical protein [unclassified Rhodanobacter]
MSVTLDQVRDWHRRREDEFRISGYDVGVKSHLAMADAIDAHLTQPAQSVDMVEVREVIAEMRNVAEQDDHLLHGWADKLTAALQGPARG